ncbi:hypothetical protein IEQ34_021123 [Dendrobium chrysotoxum]|uniref:TFIIS N-terminal domain-containing protein n=1 Tax=Dendrobium chrysotoxum TaxID=161865 RepID=A0AAV7G289_DENCH|nr:hypothetical protein IEQ34_021123 [Dendrobium chrysotoxum]
MFVAMADAKQSLDYWRKYFNSAKSDIFDLIDNAILVAAVDCPKEFKGRKNQIVEKLYTCQVSLHNGDYEHPKEEKNSCNSGNSKENDQIVREVVRLKEVLSDKQLYKSDSDLVLYESLRSLQMLQLSAEILNSTVIGRTVSALQKHNSSQIRKLVRSLIDGWKIWSEVKRKQPEEVSEMSKLEVAKKKLREGYQRIENAKRQRMIQIIEPTDLPKLSHEKRRSRKKVGKDC